LELEVLLTYGGDYRNCILQHASREDAQMVLVGLPRVAMVGEETVATVITRAPCCVLVVPPHIEREAGERCGRTTRSCVSVRSGDKAALDAWRTSRLEALRKRARRTSTDFRGCRQMDPARRVAMTNPGVVRRRRQGWRRWATSWGQLGPRR
jgi:hypothetical protein